MSRRLQTKRLALLTGALVAGLALLGLRLTQLQVIRHEELKVRAHENTVVQKRILPRRGNILDARGNLFASSTMMKNICVDPTLLADRQVEVAQAIASILGMSESEVFQRLLPGTYVRDGKTNVLRYSRIKKQVPVETWQQVQRAMTNLVFAGVDESKLNKSNRTVLYNVRHRALQTEPEDDQIRVYPNGALAAHVLGFVGRNNDTNSFDYGQLVGAEGIERVFDDKLTGAPGWRVTERDRRNNEMVALRDQDVPARDGFDVVLTVDSVVQNILEKALEEAVRKHSPANVTGIVLRPRTGEILAMASLPDFDPNAVPRETELRRNRLIGDVCEPGSTFKIVVAAGALNDGKASLGKVYHCENGEFRFGGRTLHDHEKYGALTVQSIIAKSSNIGAAKLGIELGEARLHEYMREFGFGQPTGVPLPGESRGILHPVSQWSKVSIAQIPMGHGVAVTRLQMAMAMAALANDGWLMRPMLVSRIQDSDRNVITQYQPQRLRQVVSEKAAAQMVTALKAVVSPEGTAAKAAMTNYVVAGKTGTAQKTVEGVRGYAPGKYISSFIGFFPADNPQVLISIVLDEPKNGYYGGVVATPVFRIVAEQVASYLQIPPDADPVAASSPAPRRTNLSRSLAQAGPARNPVD
jgi:cell division protein FtsI/penicillin-binding protein 2